MEAAERYPEKQAIVELYKSSTYREIAAGAEKIAAWLFSESIAPGDRVGILMDDPAEYVSAYFGVLMAGAVVVALITQTTSRTLKQIINDADITILVTQVKFIRYLTNIGDSMPSLRTIFIQGPASPHPMPRSINRSIKVIDSSQMNPCGHAQNNKIPAFSAGCDADLAQIIYTSGTSGKPKGVMLQHANLMANTESIIQYLLLTSNERHMVVLPFFYAFGNSVMLTHVAAGATMIVHQSMMYPKLVLDLMQREDATALSGVPSTFAVLLSTRIVKKYTFPCLRYFAQAGGPLSPKLAREIKFTFPEVDLYVMYGQTEASARLSFLHPDEFYRKPGSIGKAIPGVALKLINREGRPVKAEEIGEIVACGRNIMQGYWKDPAATAKVLRKEGLWTGDLAKMDEEGFFYIVSRKSEMIKSGGHRIVPKEVEEIILEHPAVEDAVVFGVADEILGEVIVACIIKKTDCSCNKEMLLLHCKQNLPGFKMPKHICFVEKFPLTSNGKIEKISLKSSIMALLKKQAAR
ncbi:MAG: acyl--CoA ligase [Deltaproteobacteria bacterium]|nr:acyl--CoA ligase [Deltaproteobacteria bacterium]